MRSFRLIKVRSTSKRDSKERRGKRDREVEEDAESADC